ncbi:MAG: Ppx/GppA phosphatase family protein [Pseudomonadota bacterium]
MADPRGVGLIDIGSNSVRLVVVDAACRAPLLKFNEKAMCGLGRDLPRTGRLSDAAMDATRLALTRYFGLTRAMGVDDLDVFATEAVRVATNGSEFAAEIEDTFGTKVHVLSGTEEARHAALGVVSEMPDADGVVGDLGGASLELAAVSAGAVHEAVSFPFGPFRVQGLNGSRKAIAAWLQTTIDGQFPRARGTGRTFYAVGGAWRAFAKLAMARLHHPLQIVDGYALDGTVALELARLASRRSTLSVSDLANVTRRRQDTLPAAALVLLAVLRALEPRRVVFSASGLREGRLFARLSARERALDPLLAAARRYGDHESRFGRVGERLVDWTDPLFGDDDEHRRRLRIAACHLSDVGWSTHPDYRDGYALDRVLHLPLPGIGHAERAFIALAVFHRYRGDLSSTLAQQASSLAGPEMAARAALLGHALQLAYRVSGATAHLLPASRLELGDDVVRLVLPDDGSLPQGEAVERRLGALAKALAVGSAKIVQGTPRIHRQPKAVHAT